MFLNVYFYYNLNFLHLYLSVCVYSWLQRRCCFLVLVACDARRHRDVWVAFSLHSLPRPLVSFSPRMITFLPLCQASDTVNIRPSLWSHQTNYAQYVLDAYNVWTWNVSMKFCKNVLCILLDAVVTDIKDVCFWALNCCNGGANSGSGAVRIERDAFPGEGHKRRLTQL